MSDETQNVESTDVETDTATAAESTDAAALDEDNSAADADDTPER